ncbi:MAG: hypothetical protein IT426_02220 [Pirellulales bacterium]|nr:hypothetical protein [Pirellulales bacterium]
MHRAMLTACLPWLAVLAVSVLIAYFLVRASGARLEIGRLRQLHREQAGGVQSLSFVLTLPVFILVMMLIVQMSQLMIGVMVVHYAAFAAARSAIVWIPADLSRIDPREGPNCIGSYRPDPDAALQAFPVIPHPETFTLNGRDVIVENVGEGPVDGGVTYLIASSGSKYEKILSAAVLACMPISPSRSAGYALDAAPPLLQANAPPGDTSALAAGLILEEAYRSMSPSSAANSAVPERLRNKLAYSLNNTTVELRFYHQNYEPPLKMDTDGSPLGPYLIGPEPYEFASNELGRQDLVIVKVTHQFALLPGPGRMLARYGLLGQNARSDAEMRRASKASVYKDTYSYAITASAALNVEGEKSVISYVY